MDELTFKALVKFLDKAIEEDGENFNKYDNEGFQCYYGGRIEAFNIVKAELLKMKELHDELSDMR